MNMRLEEQIRRYTESMDSAAAPIEELVPLTMAEDLDVKPRSRVEIAVPLIPPARSHLPGWGVAVVAAVAVVLLAIPVWLALSDSDLDVVATTVPTPVDASAADAFVAVDIFDQPRVNGMGWAPGVPVRVSNDGGLSWIDLGSTDSAGSLDFALPFDVSTGAALTVEVGGSETGSSIPMMTVTNLDELSDRVVGVTDLPQEASCCVSVFMFTDPADDEAEEFPVTIQSDGTWIADLAGVFDVTNFTLVDVSYGDPNGLWMGWSFGHASDG